MGLSSRPFPWAMELAGTAPIGPGTTNLADNDNQAGNQFVVNMARTHEVTLLV